MWYNARNDVKYFLENKEILKVSKHALLYNEDEEEAEKEEKVEEEEQEEEEEKDEEEFKVTQRFLKWYVLDPV